MTKKKTNQKKSKKTLPKRSGQDCPDGVCPIKKPKAKIKSKGKKTTSKSKDINVVVPIPAPIPIAIPVTIPIPSGNGILGKIKNVFSRFSRYGRDS
jgi:hypothetical protein